MGVYVNDNLPKKGKAEALLLQGAEPMSELSEDKDVAEMAFEIAQGLGLAIICVVENGPFDAAGIAYSRDELLLMLPCAKDPRPRTWLVMDQQELARRCPKYVERKERCR